MAETAVSFGDYGGGSGGDDLQFYSGDQHSAQQQQQQQQFYAPPGNTPQYYDPTSHDSGDMGFGGNVGSGGFGDDDYDEEPLLQELGINFQHIRDKTLAVLNIARPVNSHLMDDTDLAGPLVFCLLFGSFLLMSGKLQFGFVYGVAMIGCIGLHMILGMMSDTTLSIAQTTSVLGYSLLPMVALSSLAILLNLTGVLGLLLTALSVLWCTHSAARMFSSVLQLHNQQLLVAYPCSLLYAVFALVTVF